MLAGFHDFLRQSKIDFTDAAFDKDRDWIRDQLRTEMYVTAFGVDESRKVAIGQDPEIKDAVDALPKSKALLDAAKKMMVVRLGGQPERAAR